MWETKVFCGNFISKTTASATPIPPEVSRLRRLKYLVSSKNSLGGEIPSNLSGSSQLLGIDLGYNLLAGNYNNLEGNVPSSLAECHNLVILSLGANNLSGIISPEFILSSSSYAVLYLSQNRLTGFFPKEVGTSINLEHLDVSDNMFLEFFKHFKFLQSLNLSYNNFEGMVPTQGVFKNKTATSLEGNSKLCGGIPELLLPLCKFQHSNKQGGSLKFIILILSGLLVVTFTLLFWYFCYTKKKTKKHTSSDSETFLKEYLSKMGTTVAIQVLNLVRRRASKSFTAECEALRNIRHRNLVKVLSACSGSDYSGHDYKALIYEFMVNSWRNGCIQLKHSMPIVHCDLKPSNVLLDDDMTGQAGDFVLARFLPKTYDGNHLSSIGSMVWDMKFGKKEMRIGKRPTDKIFQGTSNLRNLVKGSLPEEVIEIADPVLVQEKEEGEMNGNNRLNKASIQLWIKIEESLVAILEIGVA
ncbi:PREDICTED: probable LRR receptor [Prunus dulcis]|uniref:PREDICTED: probable LRR receptor n=1 Tax=Prunus dulcis TaxID=3755 RepID=A0A5E4FNR9_PRUDU|nr:PREDICTED: probable LRR receptor [Prunus dulcis]